MCITHVKYIRYLSLPVLSASFRSTSASVRISIASISTIERSKDNHFAFHVSLATEHLCSLLEQALKRSAWPVIELATHTFLELAVLVLERKNSLVAFVVDLEVLLLEMYGDSKDIVWETMRCVA